MSGLELTTIKPDSLQWEQAFRLFLLRGKSKNLSEGTLGLYERHLATFRRWISENGNPGPAQVSAAQLRAYLESCQARGNRSVTVDCVFRILRTFWRFLHRDGLLLLDPMAQVERPKRERRFVKPVTPEQLKLILDSIDSNDILGVRDYGLVLFLADTGLRISEALSLRVSDIDWTGDCVVVLGKGRKERRVAFGVTAKRALLAWMRKRGGLEGEWLWINRFGERMATDNFRQRMKLWTKKAGIAAERLSPHALRHFFAIQFLRNGGDLMALQKLLGHETLDMVRNYVNLTDGDTLEQHRRASPLDRLAEKGPLPNERRRVRLK